MRNIGVVTLVLVMAGTTEAQHHVGHTGHPGMMGHQEMMGHPGMMGHQEMMGHPGMLVGMPALHEVYMYEQHQRMIEHQGRVEHHRHHIEDFGRYLHQIDPRLDHKQFRHEDPYEFDRWLKREEQKDREGKPHDPYYDQYRRYQEERREEVARRERERDLLKNRLVEEYRRLHGIREKEILEPRFDQHDRREHMPPTPQEREIVARMRRIHRSAPPG